MTKLLSLLLAASTLVALGLPASAGHCTTWTTSAPELDLTRNGAPYYVDLDPPAEGIWVYEESNGIAGLQRGDEVVDDTCHGLIDADEIIF